VFAAILVVSATLVISVRNPVHAALWLVSSFFTAAAIWLMLGAEFLAIVLVLVYVGAVMVLFLFVIMMLDVNFDELRRNFKSYLPVGAAVGALVLLEMVLVIRVGATAAGSASTADRRQQHRRARQAAVRRLRVPVRARGRAAARGDRRGDRADLPQAPRDQVAGSGRAGEGPPRGPRPADQDALGEARRLTDKNERGEACRS
jgi:NADH:ubiquinone oxidoreductase subunit 6 (subunit J)